MALSNDDIDAIVRTVIGEAGGEPILGKQAVAAVILNRAKQAGQGISDVINAPGQFEAWDNPQSRQKLTAVEPSSPQYKAVLAAITPVLNGQSDPTNGADHFFAPKTQAALGRNAPAWSQGQNGVDIGNQRFYKLGYQAPVSDSSSTDQNDAFSSAFGGAKQNAPAPENDAFSVAFGAAKATSPASSNAPEENLGQKIAAEATAARAALGAGFVQGARDVASSLDPVAQWLQHHVPLPQSVQTLGGLLPTADQAAANNLVARNQFNAQMGDNPNATAGRIAGNIAASLPAFGAAGRVAGAGADALGNAIPAAAPAIDALTGAAQPANKLLRYGAGAVRGAAQGALGAGLTSSESDAPLKSQLLSGAEFGGALGAAAPAIYDAGRGVANVFSDPTINPLRRDLAEKAVNQFGIPLRGSQISERPFAKYLDSVVGKMPMSGMGASNDAQQTAFTRAVAGTMGADADNLTPKVMSDIRTNLGKTYDAVLDRMNVDASPLVKSLGDIEHSAPQYLTDQEAAPIKKQIDNILGMIDENGVIPGKSYKALLAKGSPLDRAASSSNSNIRNVAQDIESSLRGAAMASADPADAAILRQTDLRWKNMRTIQDLAAKAGIEGEISPAALLTAVKKSYKDMAYSGAGDLGDLAKIGQEFLKEPPSSGSGERIALYELLHGLGKTGVAGMVGGAAAMAPLDAGLTLGGTLAAGRGIGSVLTSDWYRNRLLQAAANNQLPALGGSGPNAMRGFLSDFGVPIAAASRNQLLPPPAQ